MNQSLLTFLAIIACITVMCNADLLYNRTLLVDSYQNNLLFRTNDPTNETNFQVDLLISYFKSRCQEASISFPTQFQLITVTLLDPAMYPDQFAKEEAYYTQYPNAGQLVSYPIKAEPYNNPQLMTPSSRQSIAMSYQSWSYDQLEVLSKYLRDQITTQSSIPKIIFFHCISGFNIVITAFGSYQMYSHNSTLSDVFTWNQQHQLPAASTTWNIALDWYCYYLQYSQSSYLRRTSDINYQCDTVFKLQQPQ